MRCTVTEDCENPAEPGGFGCYACGDKAPEGVIKPAPVVAKCRMCDKPAEKGRLDCSRLCQWRGNKVRQRESVKPKSKPADAAEEKSAIEPEATDEGKYESEAQRMWRPVVERSPEGQRPEPTDQFAKVKVYAPVGLGHVCNLDNLVHTSQIQIERAVEFIEGCHAAMAMMLGVRKVSCTITVDHLGAVTLEPPLGANAIDGRGV